MTFDPLDCSKTNMARAKFEIILVGDSRVFDLDRRIRTLIVKQNMWDINITVRSYSEKNIKGIVEETIREFKSKKFDLLYFAGGVNDLSTKVGWRQVMPVFQSEPTLTTHISELLEDARTKLMVIALKVILCDLVGLSYQDYNANGDEFQPHQHVVNNGILSVNNTIDKLNNLDMLMGVKWSFHVHKLHHGRRGHRYTSTMSDGLHFTDEAKDKFAKYLTATFYHNINRTCN